MADADVKGQDFFADYSRRHAQYSTWQLQGDQKLDTLFNILDLSTAKSNPFSSSKTAKPPNSRSPAAASSSNDNKFLDPEALSSAAEDSKQAHRSRSMTQTNIKDYRLECATSALPMDEVLLAWRHIYRADINRLEATNLLANTEDGTFLLRRSSRSACCQALCLSLDGIVFHFLIEE